MESQNTWVDMQIFRHQNDIQNQIESSFETAGSEVEPIPVESLPQATNEVEKLVKDFKKHIKRHDCLTKVLLNIKINHWTIKSKIINK